jgi:hypothetical protein
VSESSGETLIPFPISLFILNTPPLTTNNFSTFIPPFFAFNSYSPALSSKNIEVFLPPLMILSQFPVNVIL